MSELLVLGVSHKRTPIALRERFALSEPQIKRMLIDLLRTEEVLEAAALSTCNRTEIYLVAGDPVRAESVLLSQMADRARIRPTELAGLIFTPRNCDAARHLYRVASGLDSMVLGEHEVQGQVKRAYELALSAGTTGPMLNQLFKAALETGKRVRTETRISERHTSVASVAVGMAAEKVGHLDEKQVVMIGAGETAELTAQALAARGVRTLFVSNRHVDRARGLASRFGGSVGSLSDLPSQLAEADIVVASTGSPHAVLGAEELAQVMSERPERPLVLIDIAVPRDVEHECSEIEGVTLLDLDDLQAAIDRNLEGRSQDVGAAEEIVEQEIQRFARWMGQADVTPTISALRLYANEIADAVLSENSNRWENASEADIRRTESMVRSTIKRLLHEPTLKLKDASDQQDAHRQVEVIRDLFGLDRASQGAAQGTTSIGHGVQVKAADISTLAERRAKREC